MTPTQEELKAFRSGLTAGIFVAIMTGFLVLLVCTSRWRREAIEAGAAQYNSQTGEFEWKKR